MTTVYHDAAAGPAVISGQTVAILGYGNQSSAQARNLRDSGVDVIVGNIDDSYREQTLADEFEVVSIAEASGRADIAFLLTPDEVMPGVYEKAREIRKDVPMMRWKDATRRTFGIGDAAREEGD